MWCGWSWEPSKLWWQKCLERGLSGIELLQAGLVQLAVRQLHSAFACSWERILIEPWLWWKTGLWGKMGKEKVRRQCSPGTCMEPR